ncbi:hypothetical protein DFX61_21550 [Escherichia coli]|nr:hypothetical protein [Escherichia coli]
MLFVLILSHRAASYGAIMAALLILPAMLHRKSDCRRHLWQKYLHQKSEKKLKDRLLNLYL